MERWYMTRPYSFFVPYMGWALIFSSRAACSQHGKTTVVSMRTSVNLARPAKETNPVFSIHKAQHLQRGARESRPLAI
jgi:hypothetical protein